MNIIQKIYKDLLEMHGYQGWWPLTSINYHPKDYSYPKNNKQKYEICIGCILTQNTSWKQAKKALSNLNISNLLDPISIINSNINKLKNLIKPAGYFNQKSKKLIEFTKFYLTLKNKKPSREELLNIWGIGQETADSMLLYAFKTPSFIIDNYTKRILIQFKLIKENTPYQEIKNVFEKNLKKDLKVYQEYHALLVKHAKLYYNKNSNQKLCPLYKKYKS
ncbi:MAG: endonuclease III domain-containing protein [Nanoarchaeota archaeon]|nr:endonuclease III domain-containing protein [Nanoarchaeota archaeon]